MRAPPTPADEADRMAALTALGLLDTPPEERFDRITRITQRLFDAPIVLVTLVDSERQWFKSCIGLDDAQTDREISFCGHAILQDSVFVVPDALEDERFADNPLVTGPPHIRFYAGHPLREPSGHRVGTLCVIDTKPRSFSSGDADLLADLAASVEHELGGHELARAADVIRLSEEHLNAVLSSVADAVVSFRSDGTVLSFNRAAQVMYGLTSTEVIGRPIWSLVDQPERVQELLADRASRDVGQPVSIEMTATRADGSVLRLDVTASELEGSPGEVFIAVARDITEVSRLRRRTELILRTVGQGIIGVDNEGRVTFANPAAATLLGAEEGALVGRSLHDTTHHSRPDGSPYPWAECPTYKTLVDHVPIALEAEEFIRSDGTFIPIEYSCHPIEDADGGFDGAVISFVDVTARRELDRLKDQFVSVVSHELRTPLTSIRGALGLLSSGAMELDSDRAARMLEIAAANAVRLARLVDDILDLERLRAGAAPIELARVDAETLLTTVAESLSEAAAAVDVALVVDSCAGTVDADAHRITQVLTNLVGNAVKFSPHGGVVTLSSRRVGVEVLMSVQDRGRGIPVDELDRIFLPFEQVDRRDALEKGGSGLGLAIARGIVEQHGGRIWAESQVGVGSTFVVALPARTPVA